MALLGFLTYAILDRRILNTKINNKNVTLKTYGGGGYLQTGQTYCIYNDSFLYLHIGFNSLTASAIQNGTVL